MNKLQQQSLTTQDMPYIADLIEKGKNRCYRRPRFKHGFHFAIHRRHADKRNIHFLPVRKPDIGRKAGFHSHAQRPLPH